MIDRLQEAKDLLGTDPTDNPVEWIASLRWAIGEIDGLERELTYAQTQPARRAPATKGGG